MSIQRAVYTKVGKKGKIELREKVRRLARQGPAAYFIHESAVPVLLDSESRHVRAAEPP
jgi:hypothetical protein